ncbi:MAG: GNAT family N-acetyltransferase, partial [Ktedonobacteraceae bacterium]
MQITANHPLPAGFIARQPTLDDVQAVTDLFNAAERAEYGRGTLTEEIVRTSWESHDMDLAQDALLIATDEGRVVATADMEHRQHARIYCSATVHPDFCERGLGSYLVDWLDRQARRHIALAEPDVRVYLLNRVSSVNQPAKQLIEQAGYTHIRSHWQMEIDMTEPPAAPQWPEDIILRPFVVGQDDHSVYELDEEAFSDHWGHMPTSFESWAHWSINRPGFDPALWFLAFDSDTLAGISLCRYENGDGWVGALAVRRPYRHLGLGMALLRHSFAEFYRRGTRKVGLGVDAQNLTGATRLY